MKSLLECKSITHQYQNHIVLDHLSLKIYEHQNLSIIGESGSGKSTLGKILCGLLTPIQGTIFWKDQPFFEQKKMFQNIQIIFQDPAASLNPALKIGYLLAEPYSVYPFLQKEKRTTFLKNLLEKMDLPLSILSKYPHELSGGQKQRILIARALSMQPTLLICDEITSALDVSVSAYILNYLKSISTKDITLLFITHQLAAADYIAARVAIIFHGHLLEEGPKEKVLSSPHHPYTQNLLEHLNYRPSLVQNISQPHQTGCIYRYRCSYAQDACASKMPPFTELNGRSVACFFPLNT